MTPITHGEISLYPMGNLNRTYKLFFLKTGHILKNFKWTDYTILQQVIKKVKKCGGKSIKTEYGDNLEFRNQTKEPFNWDTEYELVGLIDQDPGIHPELAADLPGVILEENTPVPVAAVDTKKLNPNAIAAATTANSGIKNTTGVYDGSDAPTPIFTINPTPEAEPGYGHGDRDDDDDEDNDDDDDKVDEVEPPEEDIP